MISLQKSLKGSYFGVKVGRCGARAQGVSRVDSEFSNISGLGFRVSGYLRMDDVYGVAPILLDPASLKPQTRSPKSPKLEAKP